MATPTGTTSPRSKYFAIVLALTILVAGAYSYRWIADDAMIDFRIVDNLLHGHGPVYNIGERVEVYTNPLWVLLLAVCRVVMFFLPLGTIAVLLGILLSVAAVVLSWRATTRSSQVSGRTPMPVGLVIFCCLPATWEFVTSGLETSLSFFWVGLSVALLSRDVPSRWTPIVIGLSTLVRPDLVLIALPLGVAYLALIRRHDTSRRTVTRAVMLLVAPTVIYEIFRMAYFGLLVSNTALVKSATSLRVGLGWSYLGDFLSAYWLWFPLAVALTWWCAAYRPWQRELRRRHMVLVTVLVGGLLHAAYIVAVGGDFMHARLLLPSLFALATALTFEIPTGATGRLIVVGALAYCAVVVSTLRYEQPGMQPHLMVSDERLMQIALTKNAHPVNESDMKKSIWWQYGERLRVVAESHHGSRSDMVMASSPTVITGPVNFALQVVPTSRVATTPVVAASRTLGQVGLAAGPQVGIFDVLSLANPVSSHFALSTRTLRPGHEKEAALSWYVARFGSPRYVGLMNYYGGFFRYPTMSGAEVRDAHAAMNCGPLRRYLESVSAPLGPHRIASNMVHALSWTTMSFSPTPQQARSQLCP